MSAPSAAVTGIAAPLYLRPSPLAAPILTAASRPPGFYVLDTGETARKQLILGPFQGKVACQTIQFGRGVCGAAAQTGETQLVPDVDQFPGHIACDGDSRSEIVVPVLAGGKVVAIIDIDCAEVDGFSQVDKKYLERLAVILGQGCDW